MEPLPPCLEPLTVLLVKDPRVSVSTPWAYKRCRERNKDRYLEGEQAFEERRKALRQADWTRPLRAEAPPPLRNAEAAHRRPRESEAPPEGVEGPGRNPRARSLPGSGSGSREEQRAASCVCLARAF